MIVYCEKDIDGNIPVLFAGHEADTKLIIELRAYYGTMRRGCLYHILSWDQAKLLRDKLSEWLNENPKERSDE